ncbi:hypothetical protein ABPG75_002922 [Micractinium tetrahymenae]
MRRALPAVLLVLLAACVAAEVEVQPLHEDTSVPGVASSTYAIVQDGRVVGVVEHYRSEGSLGRRFGPPSDSVSPVAQLLAQLWASQADALAALRDRVLAAPTRCPFARQMALARLQAAAAAAAGGGEGAEPHAPLLLQRPALPASTKPMFGPDMLLVGGPHGGLLGAAVEPMRRHPVDGEAGAASHKAGAAATVHTGPAQPGTAASQNPTDHPEDLVDLSTVQQQLFGLETAAEAAPGFNPDVDALPAGEEPALFGLGGRPLIPRPHRPVAAIAKAQPAWAEAAFLGGAGASGSWSLEPAWVDTRAAEAQPAWVEGRAAEEAEALGALPVLAMLWARFAREPMFRRPGEPIAESPFFGGRPEPMPLVDRPHHHPGMMHDPREIMHGHHGGMHWPGPMHNEPAMRRPGLMGPGPMPRMVGGEVLVQRRDGRWVPLADAMPGGRADARGEVPQWRLWGTDGSFNWGLATFVALAVACTAVWGALLAQWAAYCRARSNHDVATCFITRVDSEEGAALKPLLDEGPVKGAAVEHAAAHVAGAQSVKVLSYEPLKGSDDGKH